MFKLNYLSGNVSPGFVSLFTGRTIFFIANGLLGLFTPVFLFIKFDYSLNSLLLYHLAASFGYFFVLPWGAKLLNKIGIRRSLRLSVFFIIVVYVCYFFIDYNVKFFTILSLIFFVIFRVAFWYPYQTDFAKFSDSGNRGREVGLIWASSSFLSIILPAVGGFILYRFGFNYLFVLAVIIYLLTLVPFMTLPHTKEVFSWGVRETFGRLFKKKHRALVLANLANGAESGVAIVVWPVFIWQLLNGNYFAVGVLSSLIVFVSVILQLAVGKRTDIFNKRKMIRFGSIVYSAGWVAKIFVFTPFHVFLAGAYHDLAKIFKDTPFDALVYDLMADHGHYVDEFTVLKEMAVHLGRALVFLLAIIIAFQFGIIWTFALAAAFSLLIAIL